MKIPNAEQAYVDMQKLVNYALNPEHGDGRNKAIVFESALGFTAEHAPILREALLLAIRTRDAVILDKDKFGQRYRIEFEITGVNGKTATVRSGWIVRTEEDFPRLATVFVVSRNDE